MKLNDLAIRAVLTRRRWSATKCRPLLPVAILLWCWVCYKMAVLWAEGVR